MQPSDRFEEQIFFSTVRVSVKNNKDAKESIGTGFLYQALLSDNNAMLLLISNKHVFQDPNNSIFLNFHKRDPNDPRAILLGKSVQVNGSEFIHQYHEHPSSEVDLACINVSGVTNSKIGGFCKSIFEGMLDYDIEKVIPGQQVWFVGYPNNRFDTVNNLPVLRRGYTASIPRVDFQGYPQILIDAQVFPGSSGSPVFATVDGEYKLLGVLTQTMVRSQEIEAIPAVTNLGVKQILGLGLVLKAHLIRELVESVRNKKLQQVN